MFKSLATTATAAAFSLVLAASAFAAKGEFDNMCAQGLATGQAVKTDCTINGDIGGQTYCFGNEDAKAEFMKDPEGNVAKAKANYSKMKN